MPDYRFTGVLAVLHSTTRDGRRLDEPSPELARPLPLPLMLPGKPGVGRIDRVWRDGNLIRYSGQLDDSHPGAKVIREEIEAGRLVGMLDADIPEESLTPVPIEDLIPDDPSVLEVCVRDWRVAAATLLPPDGKPWPEVTLVLK